MNMVQTKHLLCLALGLSISVGCRTHATVSDGLDDAAAHRSIEGGGPLMDPNTSDGTWYFCEEPPPSGDLAKYDYCRCKYVDCQIKKDGVLYDAVFLADLEIGCTGEYNEYCGTRGPSGAKTCVQTCPFVMTNLGEVLYGSIEGLEVLTTGNTRKMSTADWNGDVVYGDGLSWWSHSFRFVPGRNLIFARRGCQGDPSVTGLEPWNSTSRFQLAAIFPVEDGLVYDIDNRKIAMAELRKFVEDLGLRSEWEAGKAYRDANRNCPDWNWKPDILESGEKDALEGDDTRSGELM